MKFLILIFTVFLSTANSAEEEQIIPEGEPFIIYGDRVNVENFGVISDDIIKVEETHGDLLDTLGRSSSIHTIQSGGIGQQSTLNLRGSSSGDYKVFLDGVDVTDASTASSSAFVEQFSTGLIDNIKISKKASLRQTINGGAGSININTIGSSEKNSFHRFNIGFGSFNTFKVNSSTYVKGKKYSSSVGINYINSDGLSAYKGGVEEDSYRNLSYMAKSLYHHKNKKVSLSFLHTSSKSEIDAFGADQVTNDLSRFKQNVFSHQFANAYFDGMYWPTLTVSLQNSEWNTVQAFGSDRKSVKLNNIFKIDENNEAVLRLYQTKVNSDVLGGYNEFEALIGYERRFAKDRFFMGLGTYDADQFSNSGNFEISHGHFFDFMKAESEISVVKNIKTPSLFQLFDPTYGNANLKAAKIISYEADLTFGEENKFSVAVFNKTIDNEIIFSANSYLNAQQLEHSGIELEQHIKLPKDFTLETGYSNTYSRNNTTSSDLGRRPRQMFTMRLNKTFSEAFNSALIYKFTDSIQDSGKLPSYSIYDLEFNYHISKKLSFAIKLNNIFDKDYEQIRTYTAPGRNFFISLVSKI